MLAHLFNNYGKRKHFSAFYQERSDARYADPRDPIHFSFVRNYHGNLSNRQHSVALDNKIRYIVSVIIALTSD